VNIENQVELATHIQAKLATAQVPCAVQLVSFYTKLVIKLGASITAEDAFEAWLEWLESAGGQPERPLTMADWANNEHERIATALCEVARYYVDAGRG